MVYLWFTIWKTIQDSPCPCPWGPRCWLRWTSPLGSRTPSPGRLPDGTGLVERHFNGGPWRKNMLWIIYLSNSMIIYINIHICYMFSLCILCKCVYALETFACSFFSELCWRYDWGALHLSHGHGHSLRSGKDGEHEAILLGPRRAGTSSADLHIRSVPGLQRPAMAWRHKICGELLMITL